MKKTLIIFIVILASLSLVGCNNKSEYEEKAGEFISLYYSQYEHKEEIKEMLNKADSLEGGIEGYFEKHFNNILTEKEKLRLISNRVIPDISLIDSDIVKVDVLGVEFNKEKTDIEDTLFFNTAMKMKYRNGKEKESETRGRIRLIEEEGKLKIDYFEISPISEDI